MTRKELREVQQEYRKMITSTLQSKQDIPNWIVGFCDNLAHEMCYNHHERGQRLWAFFQALDEEG